MKALRRMGEAAQNFLPELKRGTEKSTGTENAENSEPQKQGEDRMFSWLRKPPAQPEKAVRRFFA